MNTKKKRAVIYSIAGIIVLSVSAIFTYKLFFEEKKCLEYADAAEITGIKVTCVKWEK